MSGQGFINFGLVLCRVGKGWPPKTNWRPFPTRSLEIMLRDKLIPLLFRDPKKDEHLGVGQIRHRWRIWIAVTIEWSKQFRPILFEELHQPVGRSLTDSFNHLPLSSWEKVGPWPPFGRQPVSILAGMPPVGRHSGKVPGTLHFSYFSTSWTSSGYMGGILGLDIGLGIRKRERKN